jgi:threonine dehydrogenase-like Zn-dependent dehydrogenase
MRAVVKYGKGKGLLPAEKFITHRLPLEKWEEAFHLLENLQAAKVILIP